MPTIAPWLSSSALWVSHACARGKICAFTLAVVSINSIRMINSVLFTLSRYIGSTCLPVGKRFCNRIRNRNTHKGGKTALFRFEPRHIHKCEHQCYNKHRTKKCHNGLFGIPEENHDTKEKQRSQRAGSCAVINISLPFF